MSLRTMCLSNVAHLFTEQEKAIPRTVLNYIRNTYVYSHLSQIALFVCVKQVF